MRNRVADLPWLLRTPVGRSHLKGAVQYRTWPLLAQVATLHRMTLARRTRVVAVVGSFGKTTTARAVVTALGQDPRPDIALNAFVPATRAVRRIRRDDPHAVIEIGIARPGQMRRYARMVRPDVVVVTCIGSEHNRSLRSLETTRAEKAEMIRALAPSGLAVLNGDDPNVRWMAGATRARVVTFGFEPGADIRATDVSIDWPRGTCFDLHAGGRVRPMHVRLLGRQMVCAILAAVAAALELGIPLDEVVPRLETLAPTPGRLQPIQHESGAVLIRDDFKSNLETIDAALDVLAEIPAARRIVVLGDVSEPPGSVGPIYRRLGERIAGIATRAVFVAEGFQRYAAGAQRAGMPRAALLDAGRSVVRAVELVQEDLGPGDVVLIKGRDTQRLDRISLALEGRPVRCELSFCALKEARCDRCPMLERGWDGVRPPTR